MCKTPTYYLIILKLPRIRGEEGGIYELTGLYFEINFYIKIPFQEYEEPVYSYSTITTIYMEVGIHAELLANRD